MYLHVHGIFLSLVRVPQLTLYGLSISELSDSDQDTKWKFNEEAYQDFDEIPANKHIEVSY